MQITQRTEVPQVKKKHSNQNKMYTIELFNLQIYKL